MSKSTSRSRRVSRPAVADKAARDAAAKPEDRRFSVAEIQDRTHTADRLSTRGIPDGDVPEIEVTWSLADIHGGITAKVDESHLYSVAIEIPADWCYWNIEGKTVDALQCGLADGMEKMAERLEGFARMLRIDAEQKRAFYGKRKKAARGNGRSNGKAK